MWHVYYKSDLKIGTIAALLNSMGITPLVNDSLNIMAKIGVNSAQQLIRREAIIAHASTTWQLSLNVNKHVVI